MEIDDDTAVVSEVEYDESRAPLKPTYSAVVQQTPEIKPQLNPDQITLRAILKNSVRVSDNDAVYGAADAIVEAMAAERKAEEAVQVLVCSESFKTEEERDDHVIKLADIFSSTPLEVSSRNNITFVSFYWSELLEAKFTLVKDQWSKTRNPTTEKFQIKRGKAGFELPVVITNIKKFFEQANRTIIDLEVKLHKAFEKRGKIVPTGDYIVTTIQRDKEKLMPRVDGRKNYTVIGDKTWIHPAGSCFICKATGHLVAQCPRKRQLTPDQDKDSISVKRRASEVQ